MEQSNGRTWDHLAHRTIQTGHDRRSPRSEVSTDVVRLLAGVLDEALTLDGWADVLGSGWHISACVDAGRLKFRLSVGIPDVGEAAPIRCTVWPGSRSHCPRLEVDIPTGPNPDPARARAFKAMGPARVAEAADLERLIAWSWLDSLPDAGGA